MRVRITTIAVVIAAFFAMVAASAAQAQGLRSPFIAGSDAAKEAPLHASAVLSHTQVTPGQKFHVALVIEVSPGWSYYSPNPGKTKDGTAPLPAFLNVDAPDFTVDKPLWPASKGHEEDGSILNVYQGQAVVYVPLTARADAPAGPRTIKLTLGGQACDPGTCENIDLPPLEAHVAVGPAAVADQQWTSQLAEGLLRAPLPTLKIEGLDLGVMGGLALALLAGLVLNIMPCVLPVIPLKVLGIVQQAKESRRRFMTLGLAFAGGIVLFFAAIAVFNVVLKVVLAGAFHWGEHFQYPAFRIGMTILMVVLAANLFGLFTVLAPRKAGELEAQVSGREGHASALAMGVLTGVLATPCSFAILTQAFAWAQTQTLTLGSLGIIAIGVGMALPYGLLIAFPKLVQRLPRPGRWMEIFKQGMGFVLLLVAVWLLSTLGGDSYPFWVLAFCVVLAAGLWMWGMWLRHDVPLRRQLTVRGAAAVLVIAAGFWMLTPPRPLAVQFEQFDQAKIDAAIAQNRIVLVDFTADWCVNCKTVEKRVYDSQKIADRLKELNVLALKGDVTNKGMPANALKDKLGLGGGIPVTVIFPPGGGQPIRLTGIFSPDDLLKALDQARSQR